MIIDYKTAKNIFPIQNKKIIFKSGCFDIFHIGHLNSLMEAKSYADILVVGIGSDLNIKKYKGKNRPIFNENDRSKIIDSIKFVDYTIIMNEDTPNNIWIDHQELISIIKPNFYFLIKEDKNLKYKEDFAKKNNMQIIFQNNNILFENDLISTTFIENKLK